MPPERYGFVIALVVLILYAIGELTGLWKGMGRLFG